jgi:hypothetical protein
VSAGTTYVTDDTPVMSCPENRDVPEPVAIVTLCGMAASAFVKSIPNGLSAGAVSAEGENRKSRASISSVTGAAVGRGVGRGVGLGVGFGVGLVVGFAVGCSVGLGVGTGVGRGVGVALGHGVGVASGAGAGVAVRSGVGVAIGAGPAVMATVAVGEGEGAGESDDDGGALGPIAAEGATDAGAAVPHAVTNNPTAINRQERGRSTAAL